MNEIFHVNFMLDTDSYDRLKMICKIIDTMPVAVIRRYIEEGLRKDEARFREDIERERTAQADDLLRRRKKGHREPY